MKSLTFNSVSRIIDRKASVFLILLGLYSGKRMTTPFLVVIKDCISLIKEPVNRSSFSRKSGVTTVNKRLTALMK